MKINSDIVDSPPRHAASLVMLRDAAAGLEVFMLQRHSDSAVLGGAYVFPGGKLDADDALLGADLDRTPDELQASLGEPDLSPQAAAGLFVAALREAFEESGVLFALEADALQLSDAIALHQQGLSFAALLAQLSLRLSTQGLVPWSRWITPRTPTVSKHRFDTRFFVAAAPERQTARHDNVEATDSVWLTPCAALQLYWEGRITLAPPQIMSLSHLARHRSVSGVMDEASKRLPPLIEPEPFNEEGSRVLTYPGDPRHSVSTRALPGPTRLYHRNQRFEPEGGLEALLT
ncbi:MAG: NUDIX hydrolase [Hylemonella sp.]